MHLSEIISLSTYYVFRAYCHTFLSTHLKRNSLCSPSPQAIQLLSDTSGSMPIVFLLTDGAVENERHICDVMKSHLKSKGSICPRIYTFGIGNNCDISNPFYILNSISS